MSSIQVEVTNSGITVAQNGAKSRIKTRMNSTSKLRFLWAALAGGTLLAFYKVFIQNEDEYMIGEAQIDSFKEFLTKKKYTRIRTVVSLLAVMVYIIHAAVGIQPFVNLFLRSRYDWVSPEGGKELRTSRSQRDGTRYLVKAKNGLQYLLYIYDDFQVRVLDRATRDKLFDAKVDVQVSNKDVWKKYLLRHADLTIADERVLQLDQPLRDVVVLGVTLKFLQPYMRLVHLRGLMYLGGAITLPAIIWSYDKYEEKRQSSLRGTRWHAPYHAVEKVKHGRQPFSSIGYESEEDEL